MAAECSTKHLGQIIPPLPSSTMHDERVPAWRGFTQMWTQRPLGGTVGCLICVYTTRLCQATIWTYFRATAIRELIMCTQGFCQIEIVTTVFSIYTATLWCKLCAMISKQGVRVEGNQSEVHRRGEGKEKKQ